MTSNYTPPKPGNLVTSRYDFRDHYNGTNFRHKADQIDLNPTITLNGITYSNVQTVLNELSLLVSGGVNIVTIGGSGFDCFKTGVLDTAVPAIDAEFTSVFTNTADPRHDKVKNGGVIWVLAGTYRVADIINIPAGYTIIGEVYGTKFINDPKVSTKAMFKIKADSSRLIDSVIVDSTSTFANDLFTFAKETKFVNLTISDNYLLPTTSGDITYKNPKNLTVPLIYQEAGSSFKCENVSFLGRIDPSGSSTGVTFAAIGLDPTASSSTGTNLNIQNCFFDGFRTLVQYQSTSYAVGNTRDFLTFKNNKARAYPGTATVDYRSFINTNECNIDVSNNYFYCDTTTILSVINVKNLSSATNGSEFLKTTIIGNSGVITKTSASNAAVPIITFNDSSPTFNKTQAIISGNNFGGAIDSWFITVGPGDGTSFVGDFNGIRAIEMAMSYAYSTHNCKIFVLPGNYQLVTANTQNASISLEGIKSGDTYPNILINSSTTTSVGNGTYPVSRFRSVILGNSLKSLKFKYDDTGLSSPTSTYIPSVILHTGSTLDGTIEVNDCIFDDVALVIPYIASTTVAGQIIVKNSSFSQNVDLSGKNKDVSLLIPSVSTVLIDNCVFYSVQSGALNIGYYKNSSPSSSLKGRSKVTIKDTIVTVVGDLGTLDETVTLDAYYLNAANYSVAHIATDGDIYITNSFLGGTDSLSPTFKMSFTSSFLSSEKYPSFIKVRSANLFIDNSKIHGVKSPSKIILNVSGIFNFTLPTLFVDANNSIKISDSKILYASLPIQLSANSMTKIQPEVLVSGVSGTTKNSCTITNCEFNQNNNNEDPTAFIDFDLVIPSLSSAFTSDASYASASGFITIENCFFTNYIDIATTSPSDGAPIEFANLATLTSNPIIRYNTQSANTGVNSFITILVPLDVNITGCVFDVAMRTLSTDTSANKNYSVIYLRQDAATAATGLPEAKILDNKFIVNNYINPASTYSVYSIYFQSQGVINNNTFAFNNKISGPFGGSIGYILLYSVGAGATATVVCNNNRFFRAGDMTIGVNIVSGHSYYRGQITGNIFDSSYITSLSPNNLNESLLINGDDFNFNIDRNSNHLMVKLVSASRFIPMDEVGAVTHRAYGLDRPITSGDIADSGFWNTIYTGSGGGLTTLTERYKVVVRNTTDISGTITHSSSNNFNWIIPVTVPLGVFLKRVQIPYYTHNTTGGSLTYDIGALLINSNGAILEGSSQTSQVTSWIHVPTVTVGAGASSNNLLSATFNSKIGYASGTDIYNANSINHIYDLYVLLIIKSSAPGLEVKFLEAQVKYMY